MGTDVLFLVLAIFKNCQAELSGFIFEDNKSSKRYESENGELLFELPNWPHKISCCFTTFINFDRYSSIVPLVDFRSEATIYSKVSRLSPSQTILRELCKCT